METDTQRTRLCRHCVHLFQMIERGEDCSIDPFHENGAALKECKNSGCSICNRSWIEPRDKRRDVDERSRGRSQGFGNDEQTKDLRDRVSIKRAGGCIDLKFEYSSSGVWNAVNAPIAFPEIVLCRVQEDETLFSAFQKEMSATGNDNEALFSLAAVLLDRCIDSYAGCIPNRQPSSYPSRLLDLRQDKLRLIDTRDLDISGPYATLSHTWGNADIKVLTHQSLPEVHRGLEKDEIPATFRDAIKVVRWLSISYLWIDCYCIVQSGNSESSQKLVEIAKMGEVYANAILNVGATSAESPLDGLFRQTESQCGCRPMTIDLIDQSRMEPCTYLLYPAYCHKRDHNFLSSQPLFTRAWCMQERFLCPRMLHFWERGIFWECHAIYSGLERLPTQKYPAPETMRGTFSLRTGSEILASEHLKNWNQIVAKYSAMQLSRPEEDKLAACGAVAEIIAGLIGDEYIAGHFRQSLISSLTWMRSGMTETAVPRSKVWLAPSWSWASVDGAVFIERHHNDEDEKGPEKPPPKLVKVGNPLSKSEEWKELGPSDNEVVVKGSEQSIHKTPVGPCAELKSVNIELINSTNPYGALRSAAITIYGSVTEVKHETIYSPHRRECVRWGDNQISVAFDDPEEPRSNLAILLTHMCRGKMRSLYGFKYSGPMLRGPGPLLSGLV